jgi:hydroxyacylglutathione hydrolase
MKIDCLILGAYETNCYVLRSSEQTKDCILIDTGLDGSELFDFLQQNKLNPVAVVLTHGHIDHIAALTKLRQKYPYINIYIHRSDADMLTDPLSNLSLITGCNFSTKPADFLLNERDLIEQAGVKLQVLHTPGHTPGGISLYCQEQEVVFTGDALFADSIGRTDFPGGSIEQLITGIKENLLTLPPNTKVYPGHGPATSIAREKTHNQYLQ